MMLGFWSITLSIRGEFEKAALAIVLAMVCDMLDGRVARATHSQSRFGFEFDSLSDLTAFGLAPALLMYNWTLLPLGPRGWLIAGLFALCAALRLARFNAVPRAGYAVLPGSRPPSRGHGGCNGLVLGWVEIAPPFPRPLGLAITSFALLALLMVSTIPYPAQGDWIEGGRGYPRWWR
jgi:CDP-diacylglycerol--serine O-phosphatidyltransferase